MPAKKGLMARLKESADLIAVLSALMGTALLLASYNLNHKVDAAESRLAAAEARIQVLNERISLCQQVASMWETRYKIEEEEHKQADEELVACKKSKGQVGWLPSVSVLLGAPPAPSPRDRKLHYLWDLQRRQLQQLQRFALPRWKVESQRPSDPTTGTTTTILKAPDGWSISVPSSVGTSPPSTRPHQD